LIYLLYIRNIKNYIFILIINIYFIKNNWGLGIGDWGLGIGDWAQSPIPNPHDEQKF